MRAHLFIDAPLAGAALAGTVAFGWPAAAAAGALALGLHAHAVTSPRCAWYCPVRWRQPGNPGVALTFDDGPDPEVTPRLLDLLATRGVRATFFLIGRNAEAHPALVRRMRAEGHALGLHSHGHSRWFNLWPLGRVEADLRANAAALAAITGEPPPLLFRPPVGLRNPLVGEAVARLGLTCVTWTANARDTRADGTARALARLRPGLRPGGIVVLHDGQEPGRPGHRRACLDLVPELIPLAGGESGTPRAGLPWALVTPS